MAVVLAIEPDPRQAAILKRVVRERARAEICVVDTKDAAIAAMGTHPPELILLTALLSPRDEEELVAHLRTLAGADYLQTLTIPLLGPATAHGDEGTGFLRRAFKGKKKRGENSVGCDPWTFAEEVAGYLKAAEEAKAEREWRAERDAGRPQPFTTPAAAPVAAKVAANEDASHVRKSGIEAPESPPLSNAAAFAAAQAAPAPDTSAEPPVYEWPTVEAVSETRQPEPVVKSRPEPVVEATPEPIVGATREPIIEAPPEPIVEAAPEPILEAAPEAIIEIAPDPVLQAAVPKPEPKPVAAVEEDEPQGVDPPIEPEPAPEPIYLTSPDRVFEEIAPEAEPESLEAVEAAKPVEAVNLVVYRPLKRLPSLAMWARLEEPATIQAEAPPELTPESDTAGVLARLRVPPHALPVSYPRRPHIRYVRAA